MLYCSSILIGLCGHLHENTKMKNPVGKWIYLVISYYRKINFNSVQKYTVIYKLGYLIVVFSLVIVAFHFLCIHQFFFLRLFECLLFFNGWIFNFGHFGTNNIFTLEFWWCWRWIVIRIVLKIYYFFWVISQKRSKICGDIFLHQKFCIFLHQKFCIFIHQKFCIFLHQNFVFLYTKIFAFFVH